MRLRSILAIAALLAGGTMTAVLIFGPPPGWLSLLLGTIALAVLYTVARLNSRYDELDPRFGSCIPPPPRPREPQRDA